MSFFQDHHITLNRKSLRDPQIEGFAHVRDHYHGDNDEREVALVIPVGCGKSGLITTLPFAVAARRVLVIAPNLRLKSQLADEFDPGNRTRNFLHRQDLVPQSVGWESVVLSAEANLGELVDADVVITNIQQVAGGENRWLEPLPDDFFDLIIFDEAHHNVAASWGRLREKFPNAKIINLSATPLRTDGQQMIGRVIYNYSIRAAMERGYIRQLRAVRINPRGLRYIEQQNGVEVEIPIAEVRRLGDSDAGFRRQILMSPESLASIVDASILRLNQMRERTGDVRHKIIASALNEAHCRQVVAAYSARQNLRVDYVHANRGEEENVRILQLLDRHEIDVIVQVRMLGEGFDHPYLSVAAVCNVYGSLTPFLQFVGRVMRLAPNAPGEEGIVVFHAGSNVARLWGDLREYSEADQEYFEELLPLENVEDFGGAETLEANPIRAHEPPIQLVAQAGASLEDLPLLESDDGVRAAIDVLAAADVDPKILDRIQRAEPEELQALFVTRQKQRIAAREQLYRQVTVAVTSALGQRNVNPQAMSHHPPDTNFRLCVKRTNEALARHIGKDMGTRDNWSLEEFQQLLNDLNIIVIASVDEALDAR